MSKSALFLGMWLAAAGATQGQVTVRVLLQQEQFLRNESLPIKVRIVNSSGQVLHIGQEPDWLRFELRDFENRDLPPLEKLELVDPFDLDAAKVANLSIDLMPYYDLSKVGKYSLRAVLKLGQLNQTFASPSVDFNVISGTKLWEREFGVPSTGVPEIRKYALQQAAFLKELRLYLRITDPLERKVFKVTPLGTLLSFSAPETQLDRSSNLHVLFQTSARAFVYQVVTPDGEVIQRQTHEYFNNSRPTLRHEGEQGIRVTGGRRRVFLSDIPPPSAESLPPPPAPQPVATNEPPAPAGKPRK